MEEAMSLRTRKLSHGRCAYCGAPLSFNAAGIVAWRVGNRFVCNEFCADGLPDEHLSPESLRRADAELPASFN
jgi:hypothetical protein